MSILVTYPINPFSGLSNTPTIIASADSHVLWVTALLVCNRTASPLRINLQRSRQTGLDLEVPCLLASTANLNATYDNGISGVAATLTNNGTLAQFAIDGVTPDLNSRILIKDQTSTPSNGIYQVSTQGDGSTAWVLTRTLDYDSVKEIKANEVVEVLSGTVNANTKWKQTSVVTSVGTSPITFVPEVATTNYILNEFHIDPYKTIDLIHTTGVIQLDFSVKSFVSDRLIAFSNGYTQIYDCDVNFAQLNELP